MRVPLVEGIPLMNDGIILIHTEDTWDIFKAFATLGSKFASLSARAKSKLVIGASIYAGLATRPGNGGIKYEGAVPVEFSITWEGGRQGRLVLVFSGGEAAYQDRRFYSEMGGQPLDDLLTWKYGDGYAGLGPEAKLHARSLVSRIMDGNPDVRAAMNLVIDPECNLPEAIGLYKILGFSADGRTFTGV